MGMAVLSPGKIGRDLLSADELRRPRPHQEPHASEPALWRIGVPRRQVSSELQLSGALCAFAVIRPRSNVETGVDEPLELKDLRKTCVTYYDEHVHDVVVRDPRPLGRRDQLPALRLPDPVGISSDHDASVADRVLGTGQGLRRRVSMLPPAVCRCRIRSGDMTEAREHAKLPGLSPYFHLSALHLSWLLRSAVDPHFVGSSAVTGTKVEARQLGPVPAPREGRQSGSSDGLSTLVRVAIPGAAINPSVSRQTGLARPLLLALASLRPTPQPHTGPPLCLMSRLASRATPRATRGSIPRTAATKDRPSARCATLCLLNRGITASGTARGGRYSRTTR